MSPVRLYRWSGFVLLIGGLVGIIGTILDAIVSPDHNLTPQQIETLIGADGTVMDALK